MSEVTPPSDTVAISNGDITTNNGQDKQHPPLIKEMGTSSTPDLIHKASIPVLLIQEEGEKRGEEESVKVKPSSRGHTRGSSVSSGLGSHGGQCETNTTTTTNSSSSSLSNSFYSHDGRMGETISLPAGLSNITGVGGRTASDPLLALTSSLKGKSDKEKEETFTCLVEEVVALKMEMLKLKEENEKLRKTRTDMDDELHALTENLFEEAYKMVDEAKGEKFSAEKRLADATGQIEAMETQVSTLHNLLKTPSSKSSPSQKHKRPSVKKMMRKLSRKSHSSSKIKESGGVVMTEHKGNTKEWIFKEGELPNDDFKLFTDWYDKGLPSTPGNNSYYDTILTANILPCLKFDNEELSEKVHAAIKANLCVLEPIVQKTNPEEPSSSTVVHRCCELSGELKSSFRLKLSNSTEEESIKWYYISNNCRERIVSVCDFYTFLGYIQKGIIKKEAIEVYWRIAKYRAHMSVSSLSLSIPDTLP